MAQWLTNPTKNHEVVGLISDSVQWVKDLVLLWLWPRPAGAAPVQTLVQELPYAAGAALKTKTPFPHLEKEMDIYI